MNLNQWPGGERFLCSSLSDFSLTGIGGHLWSQGFVPVLAKAAISGFPQSFSSCFNSKSCMEKQPFICSLNRHQLRGWSVPIDGRLLAKLAARWGKHLSAPLLACQHWHVPVFVVPEESQACKIVELQWAGTIFYELPASASVSSKMFFSCNSINNFLALLGLRRLEGIEIGRWSL